MKHFYLFILLLMITSCGRIGRESFFTKEFLKSCGKAPPLYVRLEALNSSYLASSVIGSPDPLRCNFQGQQLVITWGITNHSCSPHFILRLSYITGKQRFVQVDIPVNGASGNIRYRLVNDDYYLTSGILTYKVELFEGTKCVASWRPRNWVDWISTEESEE